MGWAPKEYNPDDKQPSGSREPLGGQVSVQKDSSMQQSGFVWDEASGYYYDAASGFYYDGNTGLILLITFLLVLHENKLLSIQKRENNRKLLIN